MRTQYFEYLAPSSIEEAVKMLKEYEEAKILAGGQSLIPLLKTRITVFPYLVSLSSIPGLSYISLDKDKLRLGPMTVVSDIEYSGDLMKRLPVLTEAASQIADPLVRNMGTVGGNVSHADPSNDMPPVMLALRARFTVQGPSGTREIRASDFFVDTFQTAMNHDEILREISVDLPRGRSAGTYVKFKKRAGDFSLGTVALNVVFESGNTVKEAGIAVASLGPKPLEITDAEEYLRGKELNSNAAEHVARIVSERVEPVADYYGDVDFKRRIARAITLEAFRRINVKVG